jgi:hypothetical protein
MILITPVNNIGVGQRLLREILDLIPTGEYCQTLAVCIRQRLEQDRVNDAEDRRVEADP